MKKRAVAIFLIALLTLTMLPTAAFAADLPDGWWPVWSAYTAAVESGNTAEIEKTGDAVIALYTSVPRNEGVAEGLYNVYLRRMNMGLYESRSDYDAAVDNTEKLLEISTYLTGIGVDREDMIRACKAHLSVVEPMMGVYALSKTQNNTYGSDIAAAAGTYYGSIEAGAYGSEGISTFYVEIESETAKQFSYLIEPKNNGKRVLMINLNFQKEEETARAITTGKYDSNLSTSLNYINTLSSPVLIRIGAEMDVWTNTVSFDDFKTAYKYVAEMARKLAPKAELVWSPNFVSAWDVDIEAYYPGDEYVDWIGTSLYYNYGTAGTDSTTWIEYSRKCQFADPVANAEKIVELARSHGKCVIMTEGGCSHSHGMDYAATKTAKYFSTLNMVYPEIKAIVYFDRASANNDYTLTGAIKTSADAAIAANPTLIGEDGKSEGEYVSLESFNELADGEILIGSTGRTYASTDMSAVYYLDGTRVASTSGSPNHYRLDVSKLKTGDHKLEVRLNDGNGYTATKLYTVTLSKGKVSCKSGWDGKSAGVSETANSSSQTIVLNGKKVTMPTYQLVDAYGGCTNYVRLRDIADILDGTAASFNVDWDNVNKLILIACGKAYTTRNGTEGTVPFTGKKDYRWLSNPVSLNGVSTPVEGIVLTESSGAEHTYFKLRDLGNMCGFEVGWSQKTGITIDT